MELLLKRTIGELIKVAGICCFSSNLLPPRIFNYGIFFCRGKYSVFWTLKKLPTLCPRDRIFNVGFPQFGGSLRHLINDRLASAKIAKRL